MDNVSVDGLDTVAFPTPSFTRAGEVVSVVPAPIASVVEDSVVGETASDSDSTGEVNVFVSNLTVSPPTASVSAVAARTVAGTNVWRLAEEDVVVIGSPIVPVPFTDWTIPPSD
jgi:hypothetical protein